jgi:hypothetical protein
LAPRPRCIVIIVIVYILEVVVLRVARRDHQQASKTDQPIIIIDRQPSVIQRRLNFSIEEIGASNQYLTKRHFTGHTFPVPAQKLKNP